MKRLKAAKMLYLYPLRVVFIAVGAMLAVSMLINFILLLAFRFISRSIFED